MTRSGRVSDFRLVWGAGGGQVFVGQPLPQETVESGTVEVSIPGETAGVDGPRGRGAIEVRPNPARSGRSVRLLLGEGAGGGGGPPTARGGGWRASGWRQPGRVGGAIGWRARRPAAPSPPASISFADAPVGRPGSYCWVPESPPEGTRGGPGAPVARAYFFA